ncbi:MAG: NrfD/PsrC family molybdoenzyme membrane anchor subunit, partial [Syntrophorhabdales bacterium]
VSGVIGGGLYLVALYLESIAGMLTGLMMVVVLKGAFHLAHLGQPSRFWRLFLKPGRSWLARGLLCVALFMVFATLQLIFSYWFAANGADPFFKVSSGILALFVIAYSGFVMNYVRGIPFWNSALLPLLFIAFGILGGLALMLLIGPAALRSASVSATPYSLCVTACLLALYVCSAPYVGPAAKRSVKDLIQGDLALPFWIGVVLCGVVLPAVIMLYMYLASQTPMPLMMATAFGILVGAFSFTYCLLKAGLYRPLAPISTH